MTSRSTSHASRCSSRRRERSSSRTRGPSRSVPAGRQSCSSAVGSDSSADREVPIQAGARLTGEVGNFQLGVLNIQTDDLNVRDEETGLLEQVSPSNNFGVLRAFREFGNRTQIGGIFVSRYNTSDTDDHNLTYAIDGRLGIGQNLTFDGWLGLTSTPESSGADGTHTGLNDGEVRARGWCPLREPRLAGDARLSSDRHRVQSGGRVPEPARLPALQHARAPAYPNRERALVP